MTYKYELNRYLPGKYLMPWKELGEHPGLAWEEYQGVAGAKLPDGSTLILQRRAMYSPNACGKRETWDDDLQRFTVVDPDFPRGMIEPAVKIGA